MSPRRVEPDPWPWPADTQLDRARRVAQMYRTVLTHIDPDRCAELDQRVRDLGQRWAVPVVQQYDPDDLLTTRDAAEYANVVPRTIDEWRRRGLRVIHTAGGPRYRMADLVAFTTERRQRRSRRP